MVKELTGEARDKRARVANKAKVARLSSMTRKGFFAEEKPELESLHDSRLNAFRSIATASTPRPKVDTPDTEPKCGNPAYFRVCH